MDSDGEFGHGVSSEDDADHQHDEGSADELFDHLHPRRRQPTPPLRQSHPPAQSANDSSIGYNGKTSVEANKQLMSMFASMANEHERNHPFRPLSVLRHALLDIDIVCGLYIVAVCIVGYGYVRVTHMLVEGLILFALILALVAVNTWRQFLEHSELVRLLRARMELVLQLPTLAQTQTTDHPPSATFVRTKRDGIWRPLPANLLVQGDLIEVDSDDDLPGKCVPVNSGGGTSHREEVMQSMDGYDTKTTHDTRTTARTRYHHHSHHVVHPSLTSSPFRSFSHTGHGQSSASNVHHVPHSHSTVSHRPYPRQLVSSPLPPPLNPPQPPYPPPVTDNDALSQLPISNSEDDEARDEFRTTVRPMTKSRGIQSVSSLSSFTSQESPQASQQPSLSALASSSVRQFIVVEPPLKHQLEFILAPPSQSRRERPPKPIAVVRADRTKRVVRSIVLVCWIVYVVLTIIRLSVNNSWPSSSHDQSRADKQWYVALLYYSGLILLPVCFLPVPIYLFVLDAVGNAHLLVLQEEVQARTEQGVGPASLLSAEGQQRERLRRERERRMAGGARAKIRSEDSVSNANSVSSDSSSDSGDSLQGPGADIDDSNTFAFIDSLTLASSSIIRHAKDILTGHELYITRVVNPLLVLGNITVFCCLDNEGILSENEPSPDHILVFDSESKPVVIDLINDPNSENGIVMEGDWDSHLPSLKPIGLNCLLNHPCNLSPSQLCAYELHASDSGGDGTTSMHTPTTCTNQSHETSGCLCPLGREIGFDVSWVRQHFYIAKVLYHFTLIDASNSKVKPRRRGRGSAKLPPKSPLLLASPSEVSADTNSNSQLIAEQKVRAVTSIAVQDRLMPDSFHWLSSGDPLLLFSSCDSYWDGVGIKAIDGTVHSHFMNILQQWQHQDLQCIAFGYTPIHPTYYAQLLDRSTQVEYLIEQLDASQFRRKLQPPVASSMASTATSSVIEDSVVQAVSADCAINHSTEHELALPLDCDDAKHSNDAANLIDPDIEVELDEQTDLVAEDERRVRWETDADNEDSTLSASASASASVERLHVNIDGTNGSNSAIPTPTGTQSTSMLSSVKPVRILSIPAVNTAPVHTTGAYTPSSSNSRTRTAVDQLSSEAANDSELSVTPSVDRSIASLPPPSNPPAPPMPVPLSTNPSVSLNVDSSAPLLAGPSSARPSLLPSSSTSSLAISLASSTMSTMRFTSGESATATDALALPQRPLSTPPVNSATTTTSNFAPLTIQPRATAAPVSETHSARAVPRLERRLSDTSTSAGSLRHSQSHLSLAPFRSFSHRTPGTLPMNADSSLAFLPPISATPQLESPILPFTHASPMSVTADERSTVPVKHVSTSIETPVTAPAADVYQTLSHDEYLLGMVAMRDQPKIEVRSLVEHLMAAGIRFVFFSPENERKTQAFGGKIGLFTDFNVSVSLKDPIHEKDKPRMVAGKSQLPRGVSAIRSHLENVDNVPLLVSLFTDCEPKDVSEMIRIYQENGESVMCMGSSLKVENTESFTQADISASLDPIPTRECKDKTYSAAKIGAQRAAKRRHSLSVSLGGRETVTESVTIGIDGVDESSDVDYSDSREFAVSSAITSMPCALPLSLTTDLMQFIALICEGRRLGNNVNGVLSFGLSLYCQLFAILLLTFVVNAPPLFTGYQLLWLITVIVPLLSLSLFATPRDPEVMVRLADKNADILNGWELLRHAALWAARFLTSAIIYIVMELWFLHVSTDNDAIFRTFYWQGRYDGGDLLADGSFHHTLLAVQTYSQCILVLMWTLHSVSFVYRFESVRKLNPLVNHWWLGAGVAALTLQILFAMVTVLSAGRPGVNFSDWFWYIFFAWPPLLLAIDELVKASERRKREFAQHRARSHFDTVLGMHSPK